VSLCEFVKDVQCGDHHSLILTDEGYGFGWGSNSDSQLGLNFD